MKTRQKDRCISGDSAIIKRQSASAPIILAQPCQDQEVVCEWLASLNVRECRGGDAAVHVVVVRTHSE